MSGYDAWGETGSLHRGTSPELFRDVMPDCPRKPSTQNRYLQLS